MGNFGKYLAQYEMAQIDAFKASTFKLSEMIDNSADNKVEFDGTLVIKPKADANCEEVTTTISSATKVNGSIVFMDNDSEKFYIEDLSMNDVIEIVAKIGF